MIAEKRDKPGGRAYIYQQDGFTFDAGPTIITAMEYWREVTEVTQMARRIAAILLLEPELKCQL